MYNTCLLELTLGLPVEIKDVCGRSETELHCREFVHCNRLKKLPATALRGGMRQCFKILFTYS